MAIEGMTNWYEAPYAENGKPKAFRCIYFPETKVKVANEVGVAAYAHYHKYIELLYMYSGTLNINVDGKMFNVSAGELIIINSNEAHMIRSLTATREYVCLQFEPEILYAEDPSMSELSDFLQRMFEKDRLRVIDKAAVDDSPIPSLCHSIINEWLERTPGSDLLMRSYFLGIFGWIYRYWRTTEVIDESNSNSHSFVDTVRYYVKTNYATATEAEAAKRCNYSLGYFSRKFNHVFGMSFREYLTNVRVKQAVKLLISNDLSITACAEYVGFSSTSYFIKKFKEYYGKSPKKYLAEKSIDQQL